MNHVVFHLCFIKDLSVVVETFYNWCSNINVHSLRVVKRIDVKLSISAFQILPWTGEQDSTSLIQKLPLKYEKVSLVGMSKQQPWTLRVKLEVGSVISPMLLLDSLTFVP